MTRSPKPGPWRLLAVPAGMLASALLVITLAIWTAGLL
jgi:hypothetical protein